MSEFLAEENACGQNLVHLVAVGNSIIAELFRLRDFIPDIYRLETKADQSKYGDVILDFQYLNIAETQERKIEQSVTLQELDQEIRDNYLGLLTQFYNCFQSIHQYAGDLKRFIAELNSGYYIQQTIDSVLQDVEGKQLMCESLYLFGVMLLILDFVIPGSIRERLLISFYRYSASKSCGANNIDNICTLLRSTGATPTVGSGTGIQKSFNLYYPESYFGRFDIDKHFISMILARLRCDDIYNQLSIYPHPDHRALALSTQSAMLFVCLYFSPDILHHNVTQMREIVDKYFADNWVVSIYMGITVNLIDAWADFKAAQNALSSVITVSSVRGLCILQREQLEKAIKQTNEILREGILNDHFILHNFANTLVVMRQCNMILRWYFMHTSDSVLVLSNLPQKAQHTKQFVCDELHFKSTHLYELLLNCSQLELSMKNIIRGLLEEKPKNWIKFRDEALERMHELGLIFDGNRPLSKTERNPQLSQWFNEIAKKISTLDIESPYQSRVILIQLLQALEEVQEFHNLQANMLVKQYLIETRSFLYRMAQALNIREETIVQIEIISDLSYAWQIISRDYTCIMQNAIKAHPKSVIRLRAVFLKLSSAFEIPLLRINQAKSDDLTLVSNYYSKELSNYMKKVLQIIPETMFSIIAAIINIQTDVLQDIPTRLEKKRLKDYAQFEKRLIVAKLTHSITIFTEGIRMMNKTLIGVIEMDPKKLLGDGIRRELIQHLSRALNVELISTANTKSKHSKISIELKKNIMEVVKIMHGIRRTLEYIQDYLNVPGMKILQEELARIINYNVDNESYIYLRHNNQNSQTKNPIPSHIIFEQFVQKRAEIDSSNSRSFIGQLAREILHCTDPKQTIYSDLLATWYETQPPHNELISGPYFAKIREAIGPAGLVGLDRLLSFMIIDDLNGILIRLQHNLSNDKMWADAINLLKCDLKPDKFGKCSNSDPQKLYANYYNRWVRVWPTLMDWIRRIGHKQLLRQKLRGELKRDGKCTSKAIASSMDTLNDALFTDLQRSHKENWLNDHVKELIGELTKYSSYYGSYEPLEEVFQVRRNSHHMALFLFLFTIAHIQRFHFYNTISVTAKGNKDSLDAMPILIGILTVLQQFEQNAKLSYLTYLCQYVKSTLRTKLSKGETIIELATLLHFLKATTRACTMSEHVLRECLPPVFLTQFDYMNESK